MAIYNFTINDQRAPVSIIVNDELYDQCAESQDVVEIMYHYHVVERSYEDAKTNMNLVLIPQLRAKLSAYGLSSSFPVPYICQSGDLQLLAPYGISAPYHIEGSAGVSYPVLNGSGVSAGTVTTTVRSTTNASTSCSSTMFPQVFGNFRDIDSEQAKCVVMSSDPSVTRAYVLDVMAYVDQDSQNRWRTTVIAYLPSYVTIPAGLLDGMEPVPEDDPAAQGGDSDTAPSSGSPFTGAGGMGSFSIPNSAVGIPPLPTISAVDTGLVRLYCDSSANGMQGLASFLWSDAFDMDTFKKLFTDPMQLIIGASIMPCMPNTMADTIVFGNIDTEVSMSRAVTQYVAVSCGTIQVREIWGAYLDYCPFTKASIYLPYIGTREIDIDEIMGKTVGVEYHVDVMSGACVAFITANGRLIAQHSGSCGTQIPVTSQNWGQVLQSLAQIGGAAISGFVSGGAGGALMSAGLSAASNAIAGGLKPQYQHSGTVSGAAGILAGQRPYIIFNIPNQSKPLNYPRFEGYPSNATMLLGSCTGYTRVEEINLKGIGCTQPELDEIEALLKEGVMF